LIIGRYFTSTQLTEALLIMLTGSAYIYLSWLDLGDPILYALLGIVALFMLLGANAKVWALSGFLIAMMWFWWIGLSFFHYGFGWAMPIGIGLIGLIYGGIFGLIGLLADGLPTWLGLLAPQQRRAMTLLLRALGLMSLGHIHPFGFDWFRPELLFVESSLGVQPWQFAVILAALWLVYFTRRPVWLALLLVAYDPIPHTVPNAPNEAIELVTTMVSVEHKWDPVNLASQVAWVQMRLEDAINRGKELIVFPESVLPLFLNKDRELLEYFLARSCQTAIVLGALHLDGTSPRNASYIFHEGRMQIAHKVVLVPFGEHNPLPNWLGQWVNAIFYDGAVDYLAGSQITDYRIGDTIHRNAICYEATSQALYAGEPKSMIVLSNNAWFTPSIEPTLQRLLLQYYSRRYGTTIYHSINGSESYVIAMGSLL
jgi:apolipoprotein N-acyltransferase